MNQENDHVPLDLPVLSKKEEDEVMKLAAVGFLAKEIAASMEWTAEKRRAFCRAAEIPGSDIAVLLLAGRASGRATPQIKLQEAAQAGNIDAIKTLQKIQANNRFNELVYNMDDDEFTD